MLSLAEAPPTIALREPMLPRLRRVLRVRRETYDTFSMAIEVSPGDGADRPGQFNMVSALGVGEVPISISGHDDVDGALLHTTRAVGGVTRALQRLHPGDAVGLRGPYGSAWPVDDADGCDVVVVAGGIGLAPLRPAFLHLLAHRERYGRVLLHYGARTPTDLLFTRELERWRGRLDLDVEVTVDSAPGTWRGNVGVVTSLLPRAHFDAAQTVAMVCGPEVMMRFAAAALRDRGVEAARIWLSLERNMKCGIGLCGHCQLGPYIICRDGPVLRLADVEPLLATREL